VPFCQSDRGKRMEGMMQPAGVHGRHFRAEHPRLYPGYLLLAALALLLLASCAGPQVQKSPAKGVYHVVKKGETAYGIARAYSISLQDLAESNNINDVSSVKEGTVLFVPDAEQVIDDIGVKTGKAGPDAGRDAAAKTAKPPERKKAAGPDEVLKPREKPKRDKPMSVEPSGSGDAVTPPQEPVPGSGAKSGEKAPAVDKKEEIKREKGRFIWPVTGTVKSRFGIQPNKTYHNWIKITCPPGTQVKAAAAGTVIFSSSLPSFGETIIIRHQNDFATVYTHLKKKSVKADQDIKRGEVIGLAGEKDETGDTYINFEIRLKGNKPQNPLFYLP